MAIRHLEHDGETVFEFSRIEALQLIGANILGPVDTSSEQIVDAKLVAQSPEDIIQILDWLRELHIAIVPVQ
jgi:hypothetical protein